MIFILMVGAAQAVSPIATSPLPPIITPAPRAMPTPRDALASGARLWSPIEAIMAAAEVAPRGGVRGVFEMPVQRAEAVGPRFYLNSQPDYRDQRNLSVAIHPIALRDVRARFGNDLARAFLGRTLRIYGRAQRVRIDFTNYGRATGKYYYQTHVTVFDPRQIEIR
jgi:hypothetical protein